MTCRAGRGAAAHAGTSSPPATATASRSSTPTPTRSPSSSSTPIATCGPARRDPHAEGVVRRNLAFDFYFGVRGGGTSGWLNAPTTAGDPGYVDEIAHHPRAGDARRRSPPSRTSSRRSTIPGNAMVALLEGARRHRRLRALQLPHGHGGDARLARRRRRERALRRRVARRSSRPARAAASMVYVPLSGVDHADCSGVYAKVMGGQDLGDNTSCSGNDVVPALPEEARRRRLDGRRPSSSSTAPTPPTPTPPRPRWRRGPTTARPTSSSPTRAPSSRPGASRRRRRCRCAATTRRRLWRQSEAVLRMGQIREPNTATRKNNGMILASLPPGEWHTGWVRDATYAIVALARMRPHRRGQGRARLLPERDAGRRATRSYVEQRQTIASR